jgi:hypothetical protein
MPVWTNVDAEKGHGRHRCMQQIKWLTNVCLDKCQCRQMLIWTNVDLDKGHGSQRRMWQTKWQTNVCLDKCWCRQMLMQTNADADKCWCRQTSMQTNINAAKHWCRQTLMQRSFDADKEILVHIRWQNVYSMKDPCWLKTRLNSDLPHGNTLRAQHADINKECR